MCLITDGKVEVYKLLSHTVVHHHETPPHPHLKPVLMELVTLYQLIKKEY